jgi:hypothetical protein
MDVIPAFWDDELEQLALKVQDLLGDRVLDLCVERVTALTFDYEDGGDDPDVDDPQLLPADAFRNALKAELRRRLLPN